MITRVALAMRLTGVEATLESGGSRIRAGETGTGMADIRDRTEMDTGMADIRDKTEMDIGMTDMRDRTEMDIGMTDMRDRTKIDIGTTDMRSRIETDTEVANMREEIDAMSRAGDTTEETNVMIHAGDTTEETDVMIHAGDTIEETDVMIHAGDTNMEIAVMIRAAGMREGDMTRRLICIRSPLTPEQREVRPPGAQTTCHPLPGTLATESGSMERRLFFYRESGEVKKFLMKSSLDEIDTVEPLRRALRQPMQCSILEYPAASKPARDELQMITRKTRIPLSEEVQVAPKVDAPTVAVLEVTARADCMATVFLDGMEGVPPDKFYILGSGTVEAVLNDGAVLDAVIDNDSEAVIIDEDLAEQVGLGLDRSYLFETETADGRKQQITGVYHKAAIEVQGIRVTLPVFEVKNCNSDLLLGRTWLSRVHAVTIE
ncbi:hypothetical protein CBR_g81578 [Chara braunii]|uniref:Uncharacterized protein n=1 Tax=Chara braunii TaxID=69332 RepID=A0A388KB27_CHABU|nr:hypothetical protein CBR_g81578 [Chara braunii]|eukprot:GBG67153.1 hypothetical protein CBR_g81578 [Chara braunii]